MKRMAGLSALALIISSTSGCGWVWGPEGYFRDRGSDYLEAQQTAPMQLPPDVTTAKRLDPLLPIPRNVADDTAKGEYIVPRPQPLSAVADASDYSLQKSGDSRSILAQNLVSKYHCHFLSSITMSLPRLFTSTLMMTTQALRPMLSVVSFQ